MRRPTLSLSASIIALTWINHFQAMAQDHWIDQVPGYLALPACAETRLSVIVRDMSSGCGISTSYACFCSTSYGVMNTKIATAIYSDCHNGIDANSAVAVFADYCSSTPMITLSIAPATTTATSTTSLSNTASPAMPSSTPSGPTTLSTSTRVDAQLTSSSTASSLSQLSTVTNMVQLSTSSSLDDLILTKTATSTNGITLSSKCCSNGSNASPKTSTSNTLSLGAIIGIVVGTLVIVITMGLFWYLGCCRTRRNNSLRRSPVSQGLIKENSTGLTELAATETTPLFEKALGFREADPKTEKTVNCERRQLDEVIGFLNNQIKTPQNNQKLFYAIQSLLENFQDQQTVSQKSYPWTLALLQCEMLLDLAARIKIERPGAASVARFCKGQVFLTQARLQQERVGSIESSSFTTEDLFEKAVWEFVAVEQLSDGLSEPLDVETKKYQIRAMYACAFIAAQFPQKFTTVKEKLMRDHNYPNAKDLMVRTVAQQGDLVEIMIQLDESMIERLAS